MADSFNVWPGGVPASYSGESFPLPKTESLPALYGVDPTNPFFLSFLAGAAFVAFFSVARFNRRSSDERDPVTAESTLLARLTPMDLRDRRLILQAYLLYVSVLLFAYGALTFYGRIIFNWLNNVLPTAGYTDTSKFDYSSPQWPLMVALAMIGVLPVLPPVEALEVRLRHWTHRVVGIPLTIYQHSERMRRELRRMRAEGARPGAVAAPEAPDWIKEVADAYSIRYALDARADLTGRGIDDKGLIDWTMSGRGDWPTAEANRAVEGLFDELTQTARDALTTFDKMLKSDGTLAGGDRSTTPKLYWDRMSEALIDSRDELLAMLAVGAEKESDYRKITEPNLRQLLGRAIPVDAFQRGPQVGLALILPVLLLMFGFAIHFGWHAPAIGRYAGNFGVIAFSAVYEVLLIAVLFLLPLMAVLNYRFWRIEADRKWAVLGTLKFGEQAMIQVMVSGLLALVVSLIGLALLAIAQAEILARSPLHFQRLLLGQGIPLLPATLSLAGISVLYCLMVLFAVEEKGTGASRSKLIGLGMLCGFGILAYQMVHLAFWYRGAHHGCGPIFVEILTCDRTADKPLRSYVQYYNLVSILANSLIGYLSIACFLPSRQEAGSEAAGATPSVAGPPLLSSSAAILLLVLMLPSCAAMAQADHVPEAIVVGFRADAPPFSALKRTGDDTAYEGYLVDLCTKIFANDPQGRYRMVVTGVTVQDRFQRLARTDAERWTGGEVAGAKVDLLCDPVTLRYAIEASEPDGGKRTDGIFSPIVYVSGVSYLERSKGGSGTPVLGLVIGTTTRKVVLQACERDAFHNREIVGAQSDPLAAEACERELGEAADRYNQFLKIGETEYERFSRLHMKQHQWPNPGLHAPVCSDLHDVVPEPASARDQGSGYRFCLFRDHSTAAEWFCSAQQGEADYYFGDKDLIIGQVEALEKAGRCEDVNKDAPFYSYEPYALLVSPVEPELYRFVQRRIYEIFSDRSEALGLFASNFEGKAMSVPLANLFLLNGVEDEAENARQALDGQ